MIFLMNTGTDPALNLALEEYLLTQRIQDFFLVWRNRPSVIVGRNQNIYAQIDHDYVRRRRIPVCRRISGGGAVYHDLGNVNFSLIREVGRPARIDFETLLKPVGEFLQQMGAAVSLEGRSDLATGEAKISGNAQHIHKGRMLHHGTLLFDADISVLSRALSSHTSHYVDRAVDSIRKPTTNLRPLLAIDLRVESFMGRLLEFFRGRHAEAVQMALPAAEQGLVDRLAREKYQTWDWNFGHSPTYRFSRTIATAKGPLEAQLTVRRGIIVAAHFEAGHLDRVVAAELTRRLVGRRHLFDEVTRALGRGVTQDSARGVGFHFPAASLF